MNQSELNRLTDRVWQALQGSQPTALLIGDPPPDTLGYVLTHSPPYEAVIIGSLTAGQLLYFHQPAVLDALLLGKPVYLWQGGLLYRQYKATAPPRLYGQLLSAEGQLRQLGVQFYGGNARSLITATTAAALARQGKQPPAGAILTPLARDILGGYTS
ncbi:MAG: hypothetical protein R3Y62_00560 [Eubacteriales bacterium]